MMNEQAAERLYNTIYLYLWANQGALALAGLSSVTMAAKLYDTIAQEIVLSIQESDWPCEE